MPGSDVKQHRDAEELPPGLFVDPVRSERNLTALYQQFIQSGSQYTRTEFSACLNDAIRSSAQPDMAINNLLRFVEATLSKASLFNDLIHYPVLFEIAMTLFGFSQYFSDILVRDPELFRWLTASDLLGKTQTKEYYIGEVERISRTFSKGERRLDALRRMYRREVLRVGARDILGHAPLDETTNQLSLLADSLIDSACKLATEQLKERYGPPPKTPYAVIALGKLGGGELNYSSDIDILFVYEEEGEKKDPTGRVHSWHEYFNKLAEKVVQNLSHSSGEGHIYRVDIRLRPESGSGPLARSLNSFLLYYESRGELWERQMLIKARPVGGDQGLGLKFIQQLQPFVYPKFLFQHPGEAAARMKARIETELSADKNIKLRPGGIRDIEFITQSLQLLNGGRRKELREQNTLKAIVALRERGLLSPDEGKTLTAAYIFFRNVEHRLQMVENTQTHTVPDDSHERSALARRMGFANAEAFDETLQKHLVSVRKIFEDILSPGGEAAIPEVEALLSGGVGEKDLTGVLKRYGIKDLRKGSKNLKVLVTGSSVKGMSGLDARARDKFRIVARELLEGISTTPAPDMTLHNLTMLSSSQMVPDQFYDQLSLPEFRALVLRLCAISPRFIKGLIQYPSVLDEIAAGTSTFEQRGIPGGSPEQLVDFKNLNELRAGVMYALGFSTFDQLTCHLTGIADAVVTSVFTSACTSLRKAGLALFALGKYGTGELGLSSDLDLFFICEEARAARKEKLEKIAQDVVTRLGVSTARGNLYDVDTRLRPEGKSAPLVSDASAYMKYLENRSSLWERQSLTRLRLVCGDDEPGRKVLEEVGRFVYETPLPLKWVDDVVSMRRKMETRTRAKRTDLLDIKLGAGGLVDIEFIAQTIQLSRGHRFPALRERKTGEILKNAPQEIVSAADADELLQSNAFYRKLETLMRITLEERSTVLPDGENLDLLARCFDGSTGEELKRKTSDTMKHVRTQFFETARRLSDGQ